MDINQIYAYGTGQQGQQNTTSSAQSLDTQDFFRLLAAQIANQDVLNPSQDTEFMAQMAQFSSLSAMQEVLGVSQSQLLATQTLLELSYLQYGAGLTGKSVLVAGFDAEGKYAETRGVIERVSLAGETCKLWVGGKEYDLASVMEVYADDAT